MGTAEVSLVKVSSSPAASPTAARGALASLPTEDRGMGPRLEEEEDDEDDDEEEGRAVAATIRCVLPASDPCEDGEGSRQPVSRKCRRLRAARRGRGGGAEAATEGGGVRW
jgi:hypothetical protein